MKINIGELYKQYEEIQKQCIKDNYPIPFLINATLIPSEHKLSYFQITQIKPSENSNDLYYRNRKLEYDILNNKNTKYSNIKEYWEEELNNFIKIYPQFNNIMRTNKSTYNRIIKSLENEIGKIQETTKTHDGTSMGPLKNWFKNRISQNATRPSRAITYLSNDATRSVFDETNLNTKPNGKKGTYTDGYGNLKMDKDGDVRINYDDFDETGMHIIKTAGDWDNRPDGSEYDPTLHNDHIYGHFYSGDPEELYREVNIPHRIDKNGNPMVTEKPDSIKDYILDEIRETYGELDAYDLIQTQNLYDMRIGYGTESISPFRKKDMLEILQKNENGEYLFQSTTLISQNGNTMTLIKNNNFSEKDEKNFRKLVRDFQKSVNNYEGYTQEEGKWDEISFYDYLMNEGYDKKFAECNVRFSLQKNEGIKRSGADTITEEDLIGHGKEYWSKEEAQAPIKNKEYHAAIKEHNKRHPSPY